MIKWVPIVGRLNWDEYQILFLKWTQWVWWVVSLGWYSSKVEYTSFDSKGQFTSLVSVEDFARYWGYQFEESFTCTPDGYYLGIHRIYNGTQVDVVSSSSSEQIGSDSTQTIATPSQRPVVLLWHGLMTNSELFIAHPKRENNLACKLADMGYDVWLGNNRGNKYSSKHYKYSPNNQEFWNFSLDEFANYDIPCTVNHILNITGASSLTYIGFSQGTAQCFAALSINPQLNRKINMFICLSPVLAPMGIGNSFSESICYHFPQLCYLIFGRYSMLPLAQTVQSLVSRALFIRIIDASLWFLFGWSMNNVTDSIKNSCYLHLYSTTSVKVIVHWFQIISNHRLQCYDDHANTHSTDHVPLSYPTQHITTPIALLFGGKDQFTNLSHLKSRLPSFFYMKQIPHYEHLELLMAKDIHKALFPYIIQLLDQKYPSSFPLEDQC